MERRTVTALVSLCSWLVMAGLVDLFPGYLASGQAAGSTEFAGSVVTADAATGKIAVKKEGGGTRFTFVTNDKTQWDGGLKGVQDLKKDDRVVVQYQVQGSQYLALKVYPKPDK